MTSLKSRMTLLLKSKTTSVSRPTLVRFTEMDLDSGIVTLEFSETVNATSILASTISLHEDYDSANNITLTGGKLLLGDSTSVQVELLKADLEKIKLNTRICTEMRDCFIRFPDSLLKDMTDDKVQEVNVGLTFRASTGSLK